MKSIFCVRRYISFLILEHRQDCNKQLIDPINYFFEFEDPLPPRTVVS